MLKNATYDLMETAAVISKGLHRYDQFTKDAKDCQQCQQLWATMKRRDEEQLGLVVDHLKQHFESGAQARRRRLTVISATIAGNLLAWGRGGQSGNRAPPKTGRISRA